MDDQGMLIQILTTLAFAMPMLIVFLIGIIALFGLPASLQRTQGLIGLLLLLTAHLIGVGFNLVPMLMIARGAYDSVSSIGMLMSIGHLLTTLLHVIGFTLLVLALVKALRAPPPAPPLPR